MLDGHPRHAHDTTEYSSEVQRLAPFATTPPRYVGDELDATEQAAERARTNGELWAARAETVQDAADAAQLRAAAAAAREEVALLAERIAVLEDADTARARWYAATAVTRDAAHRARSALQDRGVDLGDDERVTAQEWLDAHRAEQAAEDPHREVRDESELVPNRDHCVVTDADEHQLETDVPDIREAAVADETEHADPAEQHRVHQDAAQRRSRSRRVRRARLA